MPDSRFDKAFGVTREVMMRLSSLTRGTVPEVEQDKERGEDPEKHARRRLSEQKEEIRGKKRELRRITTRLRDAKERGEESERFEQMKRAIRKKQEIFELQRKLRADEEGATGKPVTGALPDFVVVGTMKGGTTTFYHLLTQHPLVEPAAFKEPHFFDLLFDEGVEWYRRCFPAPRWEDGQRTITGEATPYMSHPLAPERMARVVPEARLIALLRNPVERTYSAYRHRVRSGQETRTFEEAAEQVLGTQEAQPPGEEGEPPGHENRAGSSDSRHEHLFDGVYVDQLMRWSEFFPREQMLVLKSEDLFEHPRETLESVLDFLDLPEWEPDPSELEIKRNTGGYGQGIDPAIRRRLEDYFEPHNRRLYDYLSKDLGW